MQTYLLRCSIIVWLTLASAAPAPVRSQELRQSGLNPAAGETRIATPATEAWTKQLETILAESELPALWAGKFYRDGRSVAAAAGVRKVGHPRPVDVNDKLHLGSCTKAMTATLIAKAITSGKLRWETTLGEVFTEHAELQASEWRHVTLTELIQHRSGAPANGLWEALQDEHPADVVASRGALLEWLIKKKRPKKPTFMYSNVGYVVLGHVLEQIEQRIRRTLRSPIPGTMREDGLSMNAIGRGDAYSITPAATRLGFVSRG